MERVPSVALLAVFWFGALAVIPITTGCASVGDAGSRDVSVFEHLDALKHAGVVTTEEYAAIRSRIPRRSAAIPPASERLSAGVLIGHWQGGHGGTWPLISDTTHVEFSAENAQLTWTMKRWPRSIAGRYEVESEGKAEIQDDMLTMTGVITNSSELGSPGTAVRYELRYVDGHLRGHGVSGAPHSQTLYLIRMAR